MYKSFGENKNNIQIVCCEKLGEKGEKKKNGNGRLTLT
jgi:hypothetical protein